MTPPTSTPTHHRRAVRLRALLGTLAAALTALLLSGTPALALSQRGHVFCETCAFPNSGEGALSKPGAIAVSDATGDVYVLDRAHARIVQYAADGEFISAWGWGVKQGSEGKQYEVCTPGDCNASGVPGAGKYQFDKNVLGLAIDNCTQPDGQPCTTAEDPSVGDLYVLSELASAGEVQEDEQAETARGERVFSEYAAIDKFAADGEPIERAAKKFHYAGGCTNSSEKPIACEEELEAAEAPGLAVGPHGTLWLDYEEQLFPISDEGLGARDKGTETDASLSFTGKAAPGLALDARGHFYIPQQLSGPAEQPLDVVSEWKAVTNEDGEGELQEVTQALDDDDTTAVAANPLDVPANLLDEQNDVYLTNVSGEPGKRSTTIAQFGPDGSLIQRFTAPGLAEGAGVAVNPTTGAVYVTDAQTGTVDLFALQEPGAPTVDDASVQDVSSVSAQLSGEIDPDGAPSTYAFRYSTGTPPGASEPCVSPCVETPTGEGPLGDDYSDHAVKAELELEPSNTYHYRLIARNSRGVGESAEHAFSTPPATGKYVADERGWEMVSPPETGGYYVLPLGYELGGLTQAAATGDALTYISSGPFAQPEVSRAPESAQILSVRGGEGWHSKDISTPNSGPVGVTIGEPQEYDFFTPDLALALARPFEGEGPLAKPPLAPPVSQDETELMREQQLKDAPLAYQNNTVYLRDDKPVGAHGEEPLGAQSPFAPAGEAETALFDEAEQNGTLMDNPGYLALINGADAPGVPFGSAETPLAPVGATPDLSHVVIWSELALTGGAEGEHGGLYEWSRAQLGAPATLTRVNLLPDEAPSEEAQLGSGTSNLNPDKGWSLLHAISNGGTRVFWHSTTVGEEHLYMRATATPPGDPARQETVQLDQLQPEASGEGTEKEYPDHPVFQTANAEGSEVFFTDEERLTPGSGASSEHPDLYVCEIAENASSHRLQCNLSDLTPRRHTATGYESAGVQGMLIGASEDGTYVYFVAAGVLTQAPNAAGETAAPGLCGVEDGPPETCNLYMRHYDAATHEWEAPQFIAALSGNGGPSGRGDGTDWDELNAGLERVETGRDSLTARVSPNGQYLTFTSERPLTGYDNHDALSGAADQEVYEYTAPAGGAPTEPGRLICVSCDPSGARPAGVLDPPAADELLPGETERSALLIDAGRDLANEWLAASLPESPGLDLHSNVGMYENRVLSSSGRLFFNSPAGLVPEATNAEQDVYEYEPLGVPRGTHQCSSHSATFDAAAGGCLGLVSSGTSSSESAFLDASETGGEGPNGEELTEGGGDVFFLTAAKLVPEDTEGAYAAYDAHECTTALPCIVPPDEKAPEVCQSTKACAPYSPPSGSSLGAPASSTPGAAGNLAPKGAVLPSKAKSKPKPLTRAQKLAKALAQCRRTYRHSHRKRIACEKRARKRYPRPKAKVRKATRKGRR